MCYLEWAAVSSEKWGHFPTFPMFLLQCLSRSSCFSLDLSGPLSPPRGWDHTLFCFNVHRGPSACSRF